MIQVTNPDTGETVSMTEDEWTAKRDRLLTEWQRLSADLETLQRKEEALRFEIVAFMTDPYKERGAETIQLGNGWRLKTIKTLNFSFRKLPESNRVDRDAIKAALDEMWYAGGQMEAQNVIDWKPAISESTYNELRPDLRAIIDRVVITSKGKPQIEIIAPKR